MNFFEKENSVVEEKDDTDIIVTYLSRIDDNYINNNFKDTENNMYICKECNNENILYKQHESEIYCSKCGYTEKIMINNENIYYKDNPKEISYFAYKRINHLNELIAQFQGKESTDIPKEVYDKVILDCTHSTQRSRKVYGKQGDPLLAERHFLGAPIYNYDGVFAEVHTKPSTSPSDGDCMIRVKNMKSLLQKQERILKL